MNVIRSWHSQKWLNSAKRRRCHAKHRAKLCAMLNRPVDCIATVGEMRQELYVIRGRR